jgi:hypothetical protein
VRSSGIFTVFNQRGGDSLSLLLDRARRAVVCCALDFFSLHPHGYVSVKNRNTKSSRNQSLSQSYEDEAKWFAELENFAFSSSGPDDGVVGLPTLIKRIDKLFCQQLVDNWVPKELEKNKQEAVRIRGELAELGCDPAKLTEAELIEEANSMVRIVCAPEKMDAIYTELCGHPPEILAVPEPFKAQGLCMIQILQQKTELVRFWSGQLDAIAKLVTKRITSIIEEAFTASDANKHRVGGIEPDCLSYYTQGKDAIISDFYLNRAKAVSSEDSHSLVQASRAQADLPLLRLPRFESLTAKYTAHAVELLSGLQGTFLAEANAAIRSTAAGLRVHAKQSGDTMSNEMLLAIAEVAVKELLLPLSNQDDANLCDTAPWMAQWHCALQLEPRRSTVPEGDPEAAPGALENETSANARASMHRELKNLARTREALRVNLNL